MTGVQTCALPIWARGQVAPVVVPAFGDPVASGATSSLARPDGNMTGTAVFNVELSRKRLALLKQAVPGLQHAAALFNGHRRTKPAGVAASLQAGEALGVKVTELGLALPEGIADGLAQAVRQGVQGVAILSDTGHLQRFAAQIDKVFRGEDPAQIPFEFPTRSDFFFNAKTAKALGLASPPALRLRADEVIE